MDYLRQVPFANYKNEVNAVIEIPKGSKVKSEVSHSGEYLEGGRVLNARFPFISNYGFIPQTNEPDTDNGPGDGDPVDVYVFCDVAFPPLSVVPIRIIGGVPVLDDGQSDYKVIAVPVQDKHEYTGEEIKQIFQDVMVFLRGYKGGTTVQTIGVQTAQEALEVARRGHQRFLKEGIYNK